MKKLVLLSFVGLALASCKPTMDKQSQYGIKGDWTLTSVSHIGGEFVKVTSFNIADAHCFNGSQWKFVSNNNTGVVSLSGGNSCPMFESNFKWFVNPNGEFEFKFVDAGLKAKNVTTGYKMKVKNQTATSFDLIDNFYVDGQGYDVTYHFVKN